MKIFWVWEEKYEEIEDIQEENIWEIEVKIDDSNIEKGQIALDIIENPEEIIIISPIAWIDLEDISISLKDWVLTISWFRKKPIDLYLHWSVLRVSEVFWGKFSRNIILPENLNLDEIKAILEKNLLIIRIPKLKFVGKQIEIIEKDY